MYILLKPKPISKKTRVYLAESYRDNGGTPRQRLLHNYGSYFYLIKKNPDIIDKLKADAKNKAFTSSTAKRVKIDLSRAKVYNKVYNFGYLFYKLIFSMLTSFKKVLKDNKLQHFYKYLLYRINYGVQPHLNYDLLFEGKFESDIAYPSDAVIRKIMSVFHVSTDKEHVLMIQKINIYERFHQDVAIMYVLFNKQGIPCYFNVTKLDCVNLETTTLATIKFLEEKFKTRIGIFKTKGWIETFLSNNLSLRVVNDEATNTTMRTISKFLNTSILQLSPINKFNIQIEALVLVLRISVLNFIRRLVKENKQISLDLYDIAHSLKMINVQLVKQDLVAAAFNPENGVILAIWYSVFTEEDTKRFFPSAYWNLANIKELNLQEIFEKRLRLTKTWPLVN